MICFITSPVAGSGAFVTTVAIGVGCPPTSGDATAISVAVAVGVATAASTVSVGGGVVVASGVTVGVVVQTGHE